MTAVLTIRCRADREKAKAWVDAAPELSRITFQAPQRFPEQNKRLWGDLTDIAEQATYHSLKLKADDWKLIFMSALKREMRIVPNLEGDGFVNLNTSSSRLSAQEFSDLLEIIAEWAARNGVTLHNRDE